MFRRTADTLKLLGFDRIPRQSIIQLLLGILLNIAEHRHNHIRSHPSELGTAAVDAIELGNGIGKLSKFPVEQIVELAERSHLLNGSLTEGI